MSLDDSFYDLLPYEAITEVEYNKMLEDIPVFDPVSISKHETGEDLDISDLSSCDSNGVCPIR